MEQPESWTNPTYLKDFIGLIPDPKRVDSSKIASFYTEDRLSCYQIADKTGLSKTAVIKRLNETGTKNRHRGRDQNNYRFRNPPYGFKVVDGKLVQSRQELKIIRLIVEYRDRQGKPWDEIAGELITAGLRTRLGKPWTPRNTQNIYYRWKGKV